MVPRQQCDQGLPDLPSIRFENKSVFNGRVRADRYFLG
jgi:hypothetical protein